MSAILNFGIATRPSAASIFLAVASKSSTTIVQTKAFVSCSCGGVLAGRRSSHYHPVFHFVAVPFLNVPREKFAIKVRGALGVIGLDFEVEYTVHGLSRDKGECFGQDWGVFRTTSAHSDVVAR